MTLYAKDGAISLIRSMIARLRLSHAYIICGEKGVGKRTLGRYMAAQILCERGSGIPCGECKACRMLKNNAHPDLIEPETSGKTGNYRVEDLRAIVSDASVTPNEGAKKIYFLPSIDKTLPAAQNVLLKIVEEPPAHVVFIMTAESKEKILPTILSRAISLNIFEASEDECIAALSEAGIPREQAEEAVNMFGGNIGRCMEYLSEDGAKRLPEAVKKITDAMLSGDEYALLLAFSSLEKDRELCLEVLAALKSVVRDASTLKLGARPCPIYRGGAEKLSAKIRQSSLWHMYDDITSAEGKINGNGSIQLVLSDLCGRLSILR